MTTPDPGPVHRHFTLLATPEETIGLLTDGYEVLSAPPLVRDVYICEQSERRLVVSAGNRAETYWNIIVELEPTAQGTAGTIYVDREVRGIEIWQGELFKQYNNIYRRLQQAGADVGDWLVFDIFPD